MNIKHFDCGFPYIVVDDFYDDDQLNLIWEELDYFSFKNKLESPKDTGTGKDEDGNYKKNNKGIFLKKYFNYNPELSKIFKANRKLSKIPVDENPSWFFKNIIKIKTNNTILISYYDDGDYYTPHVDKCIISSLAWLYREPKKFKGGDLYFPDYNNECVKVKNNRVLLFPGFITHAVNSVSIEKKDRGKYLGRYCLTTFIGNI